MEIPMVNRISNFDALHPSPSNFIISQTTLSVSAIARVSVWKSVAFLLLALLASFSGVLHRIKFFIFSFRRLRPLSSDTLFLYQSDSDTSDEEEEEEESDSDSDEDWRRVDEDFRVCGSADQWQSRKLSLRHRCSIGDLAPGKSVVKLWDNFGLELDDGYVISGNCDVPVLSDSSPAVIVATGGNNSGNMELKVWDRRVSCRIPAMLAEWRVSEKNFVRGGGELMVSDMRKPNAPVVNVTEPEFENWLDGGSYDSEMGRCCDAVRSHFLLGRDRNM